MIREFASRELWPADNNSYRSYADLGRPTWCGNVFAAPSFAGADALVHGGSAA
ncbi:MAG: aminopeptidase [Sulfuritalea sp.]|nr:aminopeptidase [Sulfuritalea sp.]